MSKDILDLVKGTPSHRVKAQKAHEVFDQSERFVVKAVGHKYKTRKKVKGKWVYTYDEPTDKPTNNEKSKWSMAIGQIAGKLANDPALRGVLEQLDKKDILTMFDHKHQAVIGIGKGFPNEYGYKAAPYRGSLHLDVGSDGGSFKVMDGGKIHTSGAFKVGGNIKPVHDKLKSAILSIPKLRPHDVGDTVYASEDSPHAGKKLTVKKVGGGKKGDMTTVVLPGGEEAVFGSKYLTKKAAGDNPDLLKGSGEGSRGGKVIGHTPSGHPIYAPKTPHPDTHGMHRRYEHATHGLRHASQNSDTKPDEKHWTAADHNHAAREHASLGHHHDEKAWSLPRGSKERNHHHAMAHAHAGAADFHNSQGTSQYARPSKSAKKSDGDNLDLVKAKYISRKKVGGRWTYKYDHDTARDYHGSQKKHHIGKMDAAPKGSQEREHHKMMSEYHDHRETLHSSAAKGEKATGEAHAKHMARARLAQSAAASASRRIEGHATRKQHWANYEAAKQSGQVEKIPNFKEHPEMAAHAFHARAVGHEEGVERGTSVPAQAERTRALATEIAKDGERRLRDALGTDPFKLMLEKSAASDLQKAIVAYDQAVRSTK